MTQYIARRIAGIVPTLLLLIFLVVVLLALIPGNIIDLILQERFAGANDEARLILAHQLGLDKPLPVRYAEYVLGALRGDLGHSLWSQQPVVDLILARAPATLEIGLVAICIGVVIGTGIGIISALKQDSMLDYILRSISIFLISTPSFVIATAIVVFPAILWGRGPSLRYVSLMENPIPHLKIIILPALVLAIGLSATLMRITRTTMLEVLRQDYIRTARAKGLRTSNVVIGHALKNALIPVVTLLGLQITFLISGSVITESVFAIPGVGRLLIGALTTRDYPVVQGIVVIVGLFIIMVNLLIDLSYAWLDPRIRFS